MARFARSVWFALRAVGRQWHGAREVASAGTLGGGRGGYCVGRGLARRVHDGQRLADASARTGQRRIDLVFVGRSRVWLNDGFGIFQHYRWDEADLSAVQLHLDVTAADGNDLHRGRPFEGLVRIGIAAGGFFEKSGVIDRGLDELAGTESGSRLSLCQLAAARLAKRVKAAAGDGGHRRITGDKADEGHSGKGDR